MDILYYSKSSKLYTVLYNTVYCRNLSYDKLEHNTSAKSQKQLVWIMAVVEVTFFSLTELQNMENKLEFEGETCNYGRMERKNTLL